MSITTRRFSTFVPISIALCGLLGIAPISARVIWVGPSSTPECETTSLAAAVLTAAIAQGDDAIHLADGVSHTNINLALNGFDPGGSTGALSIRGGFASCGDATPTSGRTLIDGRDTDPIFEIMGSSGGASMVELVDIELTGAGVRALELNDGADVSLTNVWIRNNGGGARVRGTGQLVMDSESWIFDNTVSGGFGGGINCNNDAVVVVGGPVSGNFAGQWGGGIFAGGSCQVTLQDKAWVQGNTATFNGGGLAAFGLATVNTGEAAQGVLIKNNDAEYGGGLYVDGASVVLLNTTIGLNDAERGAAIYATNNAQVVVARSNLFPCQDVLRCSTISFNRIRILLAGAVGWVEQGASLFIAQTFVEGNDSSTGDGELISLFSVFDDPSTINLQNVTIQGNEARSVASRFDGGSISFRNVTTGGNYYPTGGGDQPIELFVGTDSKSATIRNSLLWNVGATIGGYGGNCVLAEDASALSDATASAVISDPGFVDLAGGDLRLVFDSPAVDACLDGAPNDIHGQARPVDIPTNPNGLPGEAGGTFDAGSHELQDDGVTIFADRFED